MEINPAIHCDPVFVQQVQPDGLSNFSLKKYLQKKSILNHLYQQGSLSNPELCRLTTMSSPSVQKLLTELIAEGLVRREGVGLSVGGRRPVLFGLNPDARFVVGIKIGQSSTEVALFDLKNEMIGTVYKLGQPLDDTPDFIDRIFDFAMQVVDKQGLPAKNMLSVGVAMPGLTDPVRGSSYSYFNNSSETVKEMFEARFARPVFIDNDARVMALGEFVFGSARGKKHVLCLNAGSGIGLGVIVNGRLYQGKSGFAGEFGHIKMVDDGELCICGKRGCLETLASGKALENTARRQIHNGKLTAIRSMISSPEEADVNTIIKAAREGDQFSIDLLQNIGEYLGKGIAILIHIFNPEAIIIGGKMSRAGQFILDPIQQTLNRYTMMKVKNDTHITASALGEKAALLGATALAMENIFADVQHGFKQI